MKADFLFAIFPYVAVGILIAGLGLRYLLYRKQPEVVSAERKQAHAVFATGRLWQASFLLLIAGHLLAIAAPRSILSWNASRSRLYLLEAVALAVGVAALAGWIALMWRSHKRHGGSVLTELSDTVLLSLLFVGIFSGLLLALLYRWGSSWGAMILSPYVISVVRGKPSANFALQMPFLVRLHVFSLFAAVAVLPATRLGTVLVSALQTSLSWAGKPISATGRAMAAWLRKHNPAPLFWPEED
jgi:nitrate reductase gamma subunit